VLHRTIHQGVGLINHICHDVNDGEENSFPIMNLRICVSARCSEPRDAPQMSFATFEAFQETVDDQNRCISI
jgi:hypothetical protein